LSLSGPTSVLDGPDIPADPATWQKLLPSNMTTTFFDPDTSRYFGFDGTLTLVRGIPEPSTKIISLIGFAVIFAALRFSCIPLYRSHNFKSRGTLCSFADVRTPENKPASAP
jgi:hypothetical protein